MGDEVKPLGVVLAGGAATRLGGSKATLELGKRPLIAYPLAAFADAGIEAVVVAKPETELPPLDAVVVIEPPEPRHPLLGVITALEYAGDRPIVTCPCDTPFVTPALLTALARGRGPAAVHDGERIHPLLACYQAGDLPIMRDVLGQRASATSAAERLSPALVEADPRTTFNVNTVEDLATARGRLRG